MGSEVMAGQTATISCTFTGLTKKLDSISWIKSDGTRVSFLDNFEENIGEYNEETNSQITTLTVSGSENIADTVFICQFTSLEWARVDDRSVSAPVNVFGKLELMTCLLFEHNH